jgi:cell division protein FtsB
MERTKKERNLKKIFNRTLSYIILIASIFALCYSVKTISNFVIAKKENQTLQQQLENLKEENNRLEIVNEKLKDKNYFSVYVKDKYQYSSNDNSIIPIN